MSSLELISNVKRNILDNKMYLRCWQKHYFDLTGGETTEAYILRVPINSVSSIALFIAAAVQQMMEALGYSPRELQSEIDSLEIESIPSSTKLESDPFTLLGIEASAYPTIPDLNCVQLIYEIDVGPCSVQRFYIAETENEYVSLYWYTTG